MVLFANAAVFPLAACAFIDDQIEHVLAARSLGMRAFLLDRSRSTHDLQSDVVGYAGGLAVNRGRQPCRAADARE